MQRKITITVSDDIYKIWKQTAKEDGRTLSGWIIRRVLGKPAENPPDTNEKINEPAKAGNVFDEIRQKRQPVT